MFSVAERAALRDRLIARARADADITAAALVGSAARDAEDKWSDVDVALRLADCADQLAVAARWTEVLRSEGAVAELDIWSGPALYRVFVLDSTLQVDVSFWPSTAFGAAGGQPFRLLFGAANPPSSSALTPAHQTVGLGWLYALHVRSGIGRGRPLQALFMLNGLREHVTSLACVRHGLPPTEGRGADALPQHVKLTLAGCVAGGLERAQLTVAFAACVEALLAEATLVDAAEAARLSMPLRELVASVQ